MLINLRKAIDLVKHDLILLKLDMHGCHGNELVWFRSYLNERCQCVKYNSVLSDALPITTGVPQGSIFGPFLLIMLKNDAILIYVTMTDMSADDRKLYDRQMCCCDH